MPLHIFGLNHQDTKVTKISPRVLELTFRILRLDFLCFGSGSTDEPGIPETKDLLGVLGALVVSRAGCGREIA